MIFQASGCTCSGPRLHLLKGTLQGHWAVWVSGNRRVTFRFEKGEAVDLNHLDDH